MPTKGDLSVGDFLESIGEAITYMTDVRDVADIFRVILMDERKLDRIESYLDSHVTVELHLGVMVGMDILTYNDDTQEYAFGKVGKILETFIERVS